MKKLFQCKDVMLSCCRGFLEVTLSIITAITLFCQPVTFAKNDTVEAQVVKFNVLVNGEKHNINNSILLINDHTYLPVRETAQALGLGVIWKEYEQTIKVTDKGIKYTPKSESAVYEKSTVTAEVTDFSMQVNDIIVETENNVVVIDGISYLPLRDIAEAFSMEVEWDGKTQTVSIVKRINETASEQTEEDEENGYLLPFYIHNGLWGYMDTEGNVKVEPQYTSASQFRNGMAQVARDGAVYSFEASGKYGYINADGVEVVPCAYDYAEEFSDGLGLVWKKISEESEISEGSGEFIYFDKQGNVILDFEGYDAESFSGGYASISIDSKTDGFIDKNGNFMIELPETAPKNAAVRVYNKSEFTDGIKAEEVSENNYRISDENGKILSTVYSVHTPRIISKDAILIAPAQEEDFAEMQYIKSSGEEINPKTNYTNDSAMNSGLPVYKYEDTLYYCDKENIEDYFWKLKEKNGMETVEIAQAWAITSIFANDKYMYYNSYNDRDENHMYYIDINRYDRQSGETEKLFSIEYDGELIGWEDFIYEENGIVYYFIPYAGLWKYEKGESKLIAEDAEGCVIKDEYIYYSTKDGIFETDAYGLPPQELISQEEIFKQYEILPQTLGDECDIKKLAIRNNELYFIVSPLGFPRGRLFKIELSSHRLTFLENIVPDRFVFGSNSLFFYGVYNSGKTGMYKLEQNGSIKTVSAKARTGFYLKDETIYYYNEDNGLITAETADIK